ncbi:DUF3261 domain-containing protein [Endozoicomonas sp.]|uniref:DUF3261 domain-containing protein n=1 Tax=Endozoicomonas sp. TaxID=1892382 RepID=UPI002885C70C|nr:DUF3261 domain-containing protein [Endozoicomonas sp.]
MKMPESLTGNRLLPALKHLQIITLTVLVFLSGCSFMDKKTIQAPRVYLSKTLQWQLPGIELLPPGQYVLTQSVQATYGDKTVDLLFHVEKQSSRLAIAALTPGGQPLIQLVYENGQVIGHTNPMVPAGLSLPYLVSDFLLTYGRVEALRSVLEKDAVTLQLQGPDRVFRYRDQPIIHINYSRESLETATGKWPAAIKLRNQALGYQLSIQTLSYSQL